MFMSINATSYEILLAPWKAPQNFVVSQPLSTQEYVFLFLLEFLLWCWKISWYAETCGWP